MVDRSLDRVGSPLLGLVSVVTAATAVGYVRLMAQQGDWPTLDGRQAFVLTLLVAVSMVSAIGAFARSSPVQAATSAACAAGLLPLGFLALFSIGLLLIVAGALAAGAWFRVSGAPGHETRVASAVGAIAAIAILVVGFAATG